MIGFTLLQTFLLVQLYEDLEQEKIMNVKLISLTNDSRLATPEALIAYCARVSSPNQNNSNIEGLLKYCIKEKHWSIFEMVDMTVEITTSRAIAAQILRHRSFNFQEFSQRYAE